VAALASPVSLHDAWRAEQLVAAATGAAVQTALHASRHDDADGLLANTVIGLAAQA
jgi:hypothetical protein